MIYFTSDQHFDHENIIKYCGRPFNKLHKMNHNLMINFNKIVAQEDITYHLGDFSLRGPENWPLIKNWIKKLNGTHILILGNHDKLNPFLYVECGFQSVHTYLKVEEFHLIHDPAPACNIELKRKGEWWLCGHIHNLFKIQSNVVNIGVDVWDFKPISIEHIRSIIKENEKCYMAT